MTIQYLICAFDQYAISNLVKESFGSDFPDVFSKRQVKYIFNYLKDLDAKSVLLEFDYVDKDFIEDYSRYYVKCFNNSGHKCTRLHFFDKDIDHQDIDNYLTNGIDAANKLKLQLSYLGFVVIKPLPSTFIGRTCLKVYPKILSSSNKSIISRDYDVSLFGIELSVRSIAFQEQDKILAACATTAIWSAMHGSANKSVRDIPACSEITTFAINHIHDSSNGFPNKELTNKQMLRALDVLGFKYHIEKVVNSSDVFFDIVRSYIESGLPVILGGLVSQLNSGGGDAEEVSEWSELGGHAVTILGCKETENGKAIYMHDDRLGPYARAVIAKDGNKYHLQLQLKDNNGDWMSSTERLTPQTIIVPTYKKVRISPDLVRNTCNLMVDIFNGMIDISESPKDADNSSRVDLCFDIRLSEISDIKLKLIECLDNDSNIFKKTRAEFLKSSSARFHWVANFYVKESCIVKIFFDATDIPQGDLVSGVVILDDMGSYFIDLYKKIASCKKVNKDDYPQSNHLLASLFRKLRSRSEGLHHYLDEKYGSPRAPKYIKSDEVTNGHPNVSATVKTYYEFSDEKIEELFESFESKSLIWAISYDGALLVDKEVGKKGHPTLTGFKPARISGELRIESDKVVVNSKSGRYSGDYEHVLKEKYLKNAFDKFKRVFISGGCHFSIEKPPEQQ